MRGLIVLVAGAAAPAAAADRVWPVASFERLRIEGPVAVSVTTGSPGARGEAGTSATLDRITIRREGDALLVRLTGAPPAGLGGAAGAPLARVTLSTPRLTALTQQGGGPITVDRLSGDRVDIAATGGGTVTVGAIEARMLTATLVGGGQLALKGRATRSRLTLNGAGAIDAVRLDTDEATLSLVGAGTLGAAALYRAQVIANGGGSVEVAGRPQCLVRAAKDTTVRCGT